MTTAAQRALNRAHWLSMIPASYDITSYEPEPVFYALGAELDWLASLPPSQVSPTIAARVAFLQAQREAGCICDPGETWEVVVGDVREMLGQYRKTGAQDQRGVTLDVRV